MRSTQFHEHSSFEEKPEQQRGQNQPHTLREALKRLGFTQGNQVRLYGEVFCLVSDPITVRAGLVFVDALELKSDHVRRVRIPPTILQMARIRIPAA